MPGASGTIRIRKLFALEPLRGTCADARRSRHTAHPGRGRGGITDHAFRRWRSPGRAVARAVRAGAGRRPLGRMQPATGPPPTQSSDRARSGRTAAVRLSGCASWSARQRATGARTIPRRAPGTSYIDGTGRSKPGNIRHVRRRKRASFLSSAVRAHNAGGCSRRARKISKIFSHQSAVSSSLGEELRTISTSTNTGKWSDIWLGTVRWEVTRKA